MRDRAKYAARTTLRVPTNTHELLRFCLGSAGAQPASPRLALLLSLDHVRCMSLRTLSRAHHADAVTPQVTTNEMLCVLMHRAIECASGVPEALSRWLFALFVRCVCSSARFTLHPRGCAASVC